MFNETDTIPEGLLTASSEELFKLLGKPTLIHLDGEREQPIFISTLLHGNETTGFYAMQRLLKQYSGRKLPRSISFFIGNVKAAAEGRRMLNTQTDYNRTWPGTTHSDNWETEMMTAIVNDMKSRSPFSSIDIHNNTGKNPHYACINVLNRNFLPLAGMFSNTVVYFKNPKGTQTAAFAPVCPAIVLECGQSGDADGVLHAYRFLESVINLENIPTTQTGHINLYHTIARVTVPDIFSLGAEEDVDIQLYPHIENMNFHALDVGTAIAKIGHGSHAFLKATDDKENPVENNYFALKNNEIVLRKKIIPSMYTTDTRAVRQDCLCYLMEHIHIENLETESV